MTDRLYSGMILLDKEAGVTSHSALSPLKRILKSSAVGHTGTLDKFAEGLMIVLAGPCTRFAELFTGLDKEYTGIVEFGRETDTLDPEGETVAEAACPDEQKLRSALKNYMGNIDQIPPAYSAVHINGQRAYKKARSGEIVTMPARKITIHELDLLFWDGRYAEIRVRCSKGTYIRSLARDIGAASGSRAYLKELKRTKVGSYDVSSACRVSDFDPEKDIITPWDFLAKQADVEIIGVDGDTEKKIRNGIQIKLDNGKTADNKVAVFNENNSFLAFGHRKDGKLVYNFVIPAGWAV